MGGGGGTQVGVTPLVSYIGMCSAKGYGVLAFLVLNRV